MNRDFAVNSIRTCAAAAASVILLGGCASTMNNAEYSGDVIGASPASSTEENEQAVSHDPLIDAPHRAVMKCVSEGPITVLQRIKEVDFACQDVGVSAKIDEIRDAGWRIVSMEVGEDIESDRHVGFPVTIVVRKLY